VSKSTASLQPVIAPRSVPKRAGGGRRQRLDRGPLYKAPGGGVRPEQRFHLTPQLAIFAAGTADEPLALLDRPFEGVLQYLLDAIPPPGLVDHLTSYRAIERSRR
jgi:hypothetical protein